MLRKDTTRGKLPASSLKCALAIVSTILLAIAFVHAVTLTAEMTSRVHVSRAARGTMCLWDEVAEACTDTAGEIVFGDANVYSTAGSVAGMLLIKFGGEMYRSYETYTVYNVTTTDRATGRVTSLTVEGIPDTERYDSVLLLGFHGKLSIIHSDGEVYSIDDAGTPPAEYVITYDGLVLDDALVAAGMYRDLVVTINHPGGASEEYRLTDISSTSSFEWIPGRDLS